MTTAAIPPAAVAAETAGIELPKTDTPKSDSATADTPEIDTPKADTPRIDTPKIDTSRIETPKIETPTIDLASADARSVTVTSANVASANVAAAAVPDTGTPNADAPKGDAPKASGPVLAALEMQPETPARPSPVTAAQPNNVAGPKTDEVYDAANSIEIDDECLVIDVCVDRYLWQLYQKTKKEDSYRESTSKKVTVKRKGKTITVTRTTSYVVDEDFGWKDPKAAVNAKMSIADYVIGGVDRDFKSRLFSLLQAADRAGLSPGITSAFRDDYRQSIASGLKAASNRSFHGGSLRGGYGHGLAADIVSTKGATRAERLTNSNVLWKWVDTHGNEFGIGRPYLDRDPPHIAPNDGEEFARHRPGAKTRQATAN